MVQTNQKIVDRFFEAYMKHDLNGIKQVMSEDVTWYFIGNHPFAGVKKGLKEVIAFYDAMGGIMAKSKPKVEKPITGENEDHLFECVHTKTDNPSGNNVDHFACVLWTFSEGKIVEGRHFFADPPAVDRYFTAAAKEQK